MQPLTSNELHLDVLVALRAWRNLVGTPANLLESLRLVHIEREKMEGASPTTRRLATNQVLIRAMETLQKQDHLGAEILSLRFMNGDTVLMVGRKLNLSEDQIKRRQREAITNLSQIICEQETAVRRQHAYHLQAQLMPADYNQLFGLDDNHQQLLMQLQQKSSPWVTAIVGIGGIGKTALADSIARTIIPIFIYEQVIWLQVDSSHNRPPNETLDNLLTLLAQKLCPQFSPGTPPEQRNGQLRQVLKSAAYLVVIDNLESEADVAFMADVLNDLANPSKFLLTSRVRLPASALASSLVLDELSPQDTVALIRHHAQIIHLPDLANASDDKLLTIYEVTGGNPLAVKLVVGLTAVYPLSRILIDLKEAKTQEVAGLYQRIYWQTWHSLSSHGQALLELMPMAAGIGATPEQLQAMSEFEEHKLWSAISELVNRSLLEVRGNAWERRYTIHRLTESFLYTEIIQWPDNNL